MRSIAVFERSSNGSADVTPTRSNPISVASARTLSVESEEFIRTEPLTRLTILFESMTQRHHEVPVNARSRIFLVNVGANASHPARSPVFANGTFEILPIPEDRDWWAPTLPAYARIPGWNDPAESLSRFVPDRHRGTLVHDDPEFRTLTYGDNPNRSPRASGLRPCRPGDYLFFLARFTPHDGTDFHGEPAFYFIGFFLVEEVLANVSEYPHGEIFTRFGANAHVRRATYHRAALDSFWVWRGSPRGSLRLPRAVPLTREVCDATLRDAKGHPWKWGAGRSELQSIGSYTRTARLVIDGRDAGPEHLSRARDWWTHVSGFNPELVLTDGPSRP